MQSGTEASPSPRTNSAHDEKGTSVLSLEPMSAIVSLTLMLRPIACAIS